LLAGWPLPPEKLLVLISVRGSVDPRVRVKLKGLENPITLSGIEVFFVNPLLFASCTDTVKLLEA
jgi:hypothetical protein